MAPRASKPISLSTRPTRPVVSRRDELLSIAAGLFAARGFSGVTVDDIGAAAGISGPALYHHFQSKESILGEMLVAISEHLLRRAELIIETVVDPAVALSELIVQHAEFSVDHPELITVHFRDLVNAPDADERAVRRLQGRYVECWATVLLRRDATLDPHVARAAVHATLGLLNSTPHTGRLRRDDTEQLLIAMAERSLDHLGTEAVPDLTPGAP